MVKVMPKLNDRQPLPQKQRVNILILGVLTKFEFLYRENPVNGLIICEIKRIRDGAIMWIGVFSVYNPIEIRDPVTKAVQFTLMPKSLSTDLNNFEIWVFEETT